METKLDDQIRRAVEKRVGEILNLSKVRNCFSDKCKYNERLECQRGEIIVKGGKCLFYSEGE